MTLFETLNVSATGLSAQRLRLAVIANNIANVNTTRTSEGRPFRRKRVILRPINDRPVFKSVFLPKALEYGLGHGVRVVKIEEDKSPLRLVYDPTHPDAIKSGPYKGYVQYPNVNVVQEMVDMIEANRAYQANMTVMLSAQDMFRKALDIVIK